MNPGAVIASSLFFLLTTFPVQAASVRTATVAELAFVVEESAPATVVSYDHSLLSAQIEGRVQEVPVRVGDKVAQGQTLVKLECSDYQLAQSQASSALSALDARLVLARQQLQRAEKLVKQRNASEELRDQRRAELRALQAERRSAVAAVDNAKLRVSRCDIHAPFSGMVTERPAMLGSLASIGTPLVKVLSDALPELSVQIPPKLLASLKNAEEPYFLSEKTRYPVTLRVELPLINTQTRTREVRMRFTAKPALTGASGRLVWRNHQQQIPAQYAVKREGVMGVMMWHQGKAKFLALPDALEGQALRVELPADTELIIEGQHSVQDGEAIERLESADVAAPAE
ncbi:efflux RND transporter periplasmic adaptor subunit [Pontibacterium granulatum]|uniref:efflux RND transporter periplasmic adaptor subunit n=1 Tax=Pontibacterium granulatum TaxID=2036029 RepID=UPI00249AA5CE|nr:efflux RND transporter periplasmic adaptor subunit [Pontibacterium granulatum]MDI3324311.1 efflux RND transporter periplasmic adaptor subunit [Pontibacterium granulatum]